MSKYSQKHRIEDIVEHPFIDDLAITNAVSELKDKQDLIQKRTFTKWINAHLELHYPPGHVDDIFKDLKDGVLLCHLVEVLIGEKLPISKAKSLKRVHHISNLTTVLEALKRRGLDLINNNPTDIADGNPRIILGLIWQIILHFQIEASNKSLRDLGWEMASTFGGSNSSLDSSSLISSPKSPFENSPGSSRKAGVERVLVRWLNKEIAEKYNLSVRDLDKSWRDGVLFNALVHRIDPSLVDLASVRQQTPRRNLDQAFDLAHRHLGIARLLEPKDVDCEHPDRRSIIIYVAQFMRKRPSEVSKGGAKYSFIQTAVETVRVERAMYSNLSDLLDSAYLELEIADESKVDFSLQYQTYANLRQRYLSEQVNHDQFQEAFSHHTKPKSISNDQWMELDAKWQRLGDRMAIWGGKLQGKLPGDLPNLVNWLITTESILQTDIVINQNETWQTLSKLETLVQKQRALLGELPIMYSAFDEIYRSGRVKSQGVDAAFLDPLFARYVAVREQAPRHIGWLEFMKDRFRLLVEIDRLTMKLDEWKSSPDDFQQFFSIRRDYLCEMNANPEEKIAALIKDLHERGNIYTDQDMGRHEQVVSTLKDVSARWESTSFLLHRYGDYSDRIDDVWHRYSSCLETMNSCADDVIRQNLPSDKDKWQSDLEMVQALGSELCQVVGVSAAETIRSQLHALGAKFGSGGQTVIPVDQHLFVNVDSHAKSSEQSSSLSITFVDDWLKSLALLLNEQRPRTLEDLRRTMTEITQYQGQLSEVDRHLRRMNRSGEQKEAFERLSELYTTMRRSIPVKLNSFRLILPQLQVLETKRVEILESIERIGSELTIGNISRIRFDINEIKQQMRTVHVLTESICRPENEPHLDIDFIRKSIDSLQERVHFISEKLIDDGDHVTDFNAIDQTLQGLFEATDLELANECNDLRTGNALAVLDQHKASFEVDPITTRINHLLNDMQRIVTDKTIDQSLVYRLELAKKRQLYLQEEIDRIRRTIEEEIVNEQQLQVLRDRYIECRQQLQTQLNSVEEQTNINTEQRSSNRTATCSETLEHLKKLLDQLEPLIQTHVMAAYLQETTELECHLESLIDKGNIIEQKTKEPCNKSQLEQENDSQTKQREYVKSELNRTDLWAQDALLLTELQPIDANHVKSLLIQVNDRMDNLPAEYDSLNRLETLCVSEALDSIKTVQTKINELRTKLPIWRLELTTLFEFWTMMDELDEWANEIEQKLIHLEQTSESGLQVALDVVEDIHRETIDQIDRLNHLYVVSERLQAEERQNQIVQTERRIRRIEQELLPRTKYALKHKMDIFSRLQAFCDYDDYATSQLTRSDTVGLSEVVVVHGLATALSDNRQIRDEAVELLTDIGAFEGDFLQPERDRLPTKFHQLLGRFDNLKHLTEKRDQFFSFAISFFDRTKIARSFIAKHKNDIKSVIDEDEKRQLQDNWERASNDIRQLLDDLPNLLTLQKAARVELIWDDHPNIADIGHEMSALRLENVNTLIDSERRVELLSVIDQETAFLVEIGVWIERTWSKLNAISDGGRNVDKDSVEDVSQLAIGTEDQLKAIDIVLERLEDNTDPEFEKLRLDVANAKAKLLQLNEGIKQTRMKLYNLHSDITSLSDSAETLNKWLVEKEVLLSEIGRSDPKLLPEYSDHLQIIQTVLSDDQSLPISNFKSTLKSFIGKYPNAKETIIRFEDLDRTTDTWIDAIKSTGPDIIEDFLQKKLVDLTDCLTILESETENITCSSLVDFDQQIGIIQRLEATLSLFEFDENVLEKTVDNLCKSIVSRKHKSHLVAGSFADLHKRSFTLRGQFVKLKALLLDRKQMVAKLEAKLEGIPNWLASLETNTEELEIRTNKSSGNFNETMKTIEDVRTLRSAVFDHLHLFDDLQTNINQFDSIKKADIVQLCGRHGLLLDRLNVLMDTIINEQQKHADEQQKHADELNHRLQQLDDVYTAKQSFELSVHERITIIQELITPIEKVQIDIEQLAQSVSLREMLISRVEQMLVLRQNCLVELQSEAATDDSLDKIEHDLLLIEGPFAEIENSLTNLDADSKSAQSSIDSAKISLRNILEQLGNISPITSEHRSRLSIRRIQTEELLNRTEDLQLRLDLINDIDDQITKLGDSLATFEGISGDICNKYRGNSRLLEQAKEDSIAIENVLSRINAIKPNLTSVEKSVIQTVPSNERRIRLETLRLTVNQQTAVLKEFLFGILNEVSEEEVFRNDCQIVSTDMNALNSRILNMSKSSPAMSKQLTDEKVARMSLLADDVDRMKCRLPDLKKRRNMPRRYVNHVDRRDDPLKLAVKQLMKIDPVFSETKAVVCREFELMTITESVITTVEVILYNMRELEESLVDPDYPLSKQKNALEELGRKKAELEQLFIGIPKDIEQTEALLRKTDQDIRNISDKLDQFTGEILNRCKVFDVCETEINEMEFKMSNLMQCLKNEKSPTFLANYLENTQDKRRQLLENVDRIANLIKMDKVPTLCRVKLEALRQKTFESIAQCSAYEDDARRLLQKEQSLEELKTAIDRGVANLEDPNAIPSVYRSNAVDLTARLKTAGQCGVVESELLNQADSLAQQLDQRWSVWQQFRNQLNEATDLLDQLRRPLDAVQSGQLKSVDRVKSILLDLKMVSMKLSQIEPIKCRLEDLSETLDPLESVYAEVRFFDVDAEQTQHQYQDAMNIMQCEIDDEIQLIEQVKLKRLTLGILRKQIDDLNSCDSEKQMEYFKNVRKEVEKIKTEIAATAVFEGEYPSRQFVQRSEDFSPQTLEPMLMEISSKLTSEKERLASKIDSLSEFDRIKQPLALHLTDLENQMAIIDTNYEHQLQSLSVADQDLHSLQSLISAIDEQRTLNDSANQTANKLGDCPQVVQDMSSFSDRIHGLDVHAQDLLARLDRDVLNERQLVRNAGEIMANLDAIGDSQSKLALLSDVDQMNQQMIDIRRRLDDVQFRIDDIIRRTSEPVGLVIRNQLPSILPEQAEQLHLSLDAFQHQLTIRTQLTALTPIMETLRATLSELENSTVDCTLGDQEIQLCKVDELRASLQMKLAEIPSINEPTTLQLRQDADWELSQLASWLARLQRRLASLADMDDRLDQLEAHLETVLNNRTMVESIELRTLKMELNTLENEAAHLGDEGPIQRRARTLLEVTQNRLNEVNEDSRVCDLLRPLIIDADQLLDDSTAIPTDYHFLVDDLSKAIGTMESNVDKPSNELSRLLKEAFRCQQQLESRHQAWGSFVRHRDEATALLNQLRNPLSSVNVGDLFDLDEVQRHLQDLTAGRDRLDELESKRQNLQQLSEFLRPLECSHSDVHTFYADLEQLRQNYHDTIREISVEIEQEEDLRNKYDRYFVDLNAVKTQITEVLMLDDFDQQQQTIQSLSNDLNQFESKISTLSSVSSMACVARKFVLRSSASLPDNLTFIYADLRRSLSETLPSSSKDQPDFSGQLDAGTDTYPDQDPLTLLHTKSTVESAPLQLSPIPDDPMSALDDEDEQEPEVDDEQLIHRQSRWRRVLRAALPLQVQLFTLSPSLPSAFSPGNVGAIIGSRLFGALLRR